MTFISKAFLANPVCIYSLGGGGGGVSQSIYTQELGLGCGEVNKNKSFYLRVVLLISEELKLTHYMM